MELRVGRVYRAKKPIRTRYGYINDRQVIFMNDQVVQYDGPSVRDGAHYPTIPMGKFLEWAGEDVTEKYKLLPAGEWAEWARGWQAAEAKD